MRYLHLFLIFSLFVCYSGICGDTAHSEASSSEAPESCHGMEHEMADTDVVDITLSQNGKQDTHESPCCLETLLNSSPDENVSIEFTLAQILPLKELYPQTFKSIKSSKDRLCREHDPPDLQISYSSFLL